MRTLILWLDQARDVRPDVDAQLGREYQMYTSLARSSGRRKRNETTGFDSIEPVEAFQKY